MNLKAKDYFPPILNSIYFYNSLGNNFFNFKRSIDYYDNNRIQVRFNNNKIQFLNIYEYSDLGIKLISCKKNINYIQNFLNSPSTINDYLIKEPISKGNSWFLSDGSFRSITNTNTEVKTNFNLFKSALEIVTVTNDTEFSIDYYVPEIGLVKSVYYTKEIGFIYCELEDILEFTPIVSNINFYYPDNNLNAIWCLSKDIEFYTNDAPSLIFPKEFQKPPKGLLQLLNHNIIINKLYYDLKNDLVLIDLSHDFFDAFRTNMKYFNLILLCLSKTLQEYYHTSNVSITIDNKKVDYQLNNLQLAETPSKWRVSNCNFPFTYKIKETDTILSISRKFDIPYEKIAKLNNIKNPNKITKDQVFQLYSSGMYIVKENDTLEDICNNFGLSYEKLININNINDLSVIKAGFKLNLY